MPTAADDVHIEYYKPYWPTIDGAPAYSANIFIGTIGANAQLFIQNGGTLSTGGNAVMGAGGGGSVTVTGPGSRWDIAGDLTMGYDPALGYGGGLITVLDGGVLTTRTARLGAKSANAHGDVTVDGVGSRWINGGLLTIYGSDYDDNLIVRAGGSVETGDVILGGNATITGAGSTLTTGAVSVIAHQFADPYPDYSNYYRGILSILNGAVVTSTSVFLDAGTARVDGAGSRWTIDGALAVGTAPDQINTATLTLANGGLVSVGGGGGTVHLGGADASAPAATLIIGGGADAAPGMLEAASVDTGANGTVVFQHNASDYAFDPTITGLGKVSVLAGTTTLWSVNSYQGGTTLTGGTLIGTVESFGTGAIANAGTLVLDQDGNGFFGNVLSGAGALIKRGEGAVNITSVSTLSGTISIEEGALFVNGSLASAGVTVLGGALLGGSGTVGAVQVLAGGVLAPGNSIGTLSTGDITFAAGSYLDVEAAADGTADAITAGGVATLEGGTVRVTTLDDETSYTNGIRYTILTASGGVAGTFEGAFLDSTFLNADLAYGGDAVELILSLVRDPDTIFIEAAATANQYATAFALQTLPQQGSTLALYNALLALPTDDAAQAAFDVLSGEAHASAQSVLVEDSQFLRSAVYERLLATGDARAPAPAPAYPVKGLPAAAAAEPSHGLWAQAFGGWGSIDGNGNAAAVDHDTGGFLIGADTLIADAWRLGVFGGYSQASSDVDERLSSGNADSYHAGVYAGSEWGAVALRAGAAYSWSDIETSRVAAFPGFLDQLTASYDAGLAQLFGELGYRFTAGGATFEPIAGLAYVHLDTDGFTESGGAAALTGASSSFDTTYTTLGLRASADIALGTLDAQLRGMAGWRHAFGDTTPFSTFAFEGSVPFTVAGGPIAEDALAVEAGLDIRLTERGRLGVTYAGQFGDGSELQAVQGLLAWRF